jgi:hypothetical protein
MASRRGSERGFIRFRIARNLPIVSLDARICILVEFRLKRIFWRIVFAVLTAENNVSSNWFAPWTHLDAPTGVSSIKFGSRFG